MSCHGCERQTWWGLVEPSQDKKPAVRSEEAIGKAIEDIMKKVQGLTVSECDGLRVLLKEHSDVISVGDGAIWGVLVCYVTRLIQEMPRPSISQPAGCPSIKEDWCKI